MAANLYGLIPGTTSTGRREQSERDLLPGFRTGKKPSCTEPLPAVSPGDNPHAIPENMMNKIPTKGHRWSQNNLAAILKLRGDGIRLDNGQVIPSNIRFSDLAQLIRLNYTEFMQAQLTTASLSDKKLIYRFGRRAFKPAHRRYFTDRGQSVYFAGNREKGLIKIGHARDISRRLRALQTACPFDLFVFAAYRNCGSNMEAFFHAKYKAQNKRGEWFKIEGQLAADLDHVDPVSISQFAFGQTPQFRRVA